MTDIKWPKHEAELILTHNEHKSSHLSIEEAGLADPEHWVSEEERLKAIKEDSVWVLQWYPRTPVSFWRVQASTFEAAYAAAMEIDANE